MLFLKGLGFQFSDGNTRPWYSYALALQALCVNGIGANRIELTEILARQSENGGFGSHESSGKY